MTGPEVPCHAHVHKKVRSLRFCCFGRQVAAASRQPAGGEGMVVLYDPEASFCATVLRCKGSVLPIVYRQPLFWFLVFVHVGLLVIDRYILVVEEVIDPNAPPRPAGASWKLSPDSALPQISWSAVSTLTALLTLFIVFFGTQAYDRLRHFYLQCVGLSGIVMNWTTLVRNNVPRYDDDDGKLHWQLVRLLLASQQVLFFTIEASSSGRTIDQTESSLLIDGGLLQQIELDRLKAYKGYTPYLPLVWALRELHAALVAHGGGTLDHELVALEGEFRQLAFDFRGCCGQISNWLVQPVPFPYFQMLTLLLLTDLLAISYGLVLLRFNTGLTALIYVIIITMFLGLKGVAVQMAVRAPHPARKRLITGPSRCRQPMPLPPRVNEKWRGVWGDDEAPTPPDHALASRLQNPFGDDSLDFNVQKMLEDTVANARSMLDDQWNPQCTDLVPVANRPASIHVAGMGATALNPSLSAAIADVNMAAASPELPYGSLPREGRLRDGFMRAACRAKNRTRTSHARMQGAYEELAPCSPMSSSSPGKVVGLRHAGRFDGRSRSGSRAASPEVRSGSRPVSRAGTDGSPEVRSGSVRGSPELRSASRGSPELSSSPLSRRRRGNSQKGPNRERSASRSFTAASTSPRIDMILSPRVAPSPTAAPRIDGSVMEASTGTRSSSEHPASCEA